MGVQSWRGVMVWGVLFLWGMVLGYRYGGGMALERGMVQGMVPYPTVERMIHCENITFPQLRWPVVINRKKNWSERISLDGSV